MPRPAVREDLSKRPFVDAVAEDFRPVQMQDRNVVAVLPEPAFVLRRGDVHKVDLEGDFSAHLLHHVPRRVTERTVGLGEEGDAHEETVPASGGHRRNDERLDRPCRRHRVERLVHLGKRISLQP